MFRLPAWARLPAGLGILLLSSALHPLLVGSPAASAPAAGPPGEPLGSGWRAAAHLLGGFRPAAIDLLWVRADSLFRQGRLWELAALFGGIAALDPGNAAVREYAAWHLAYNVALAEPDGRRRFEWFLRGMEFLGAAPGGRPPRAAEAWAARMMVDRYEAGIIPGFAGKIRRLWGAPPLEVAADWLEEATGGPGAPASAHAYLLYCCSRLEAEAEEAGDPRSSRGWGERKSRALARAMTLYPREDWTAWR